MGLDETGRFVAGDYMCTSFIDIREGNIFNAKSEAFMNIFVKNSMWK